MPLAKLHFDPETRTYQQVATAGKAAYKGFLGTNRENTRSALAGFDQMEARARALVESDILAAAQTHQHHATGGITITNIQEAKDYFGVR